MQLQHILVVNVILSCSLDSVLGHGRLIDPPGRSTMWRYGFSNPPNYNDNQLYCGGVQVGYWSIGGYAIYCTSPCMISNALEVSNSRSVRFVCGRSLVQSQDVFVSHSFKQIYLRTVSVLLYNSFFYRI